MTEKEARVILENYLKEASEEESEDIADFLEENGLYNPERENCEVVKCLSKNVDGYDFLCKDVDTGEEFCVYVFLNGTVVIEPQ